MNAARQGDADRALAALASAGTMASSTGSATAVPSPLRRVRLSSDLPVSSNITSRRSVKTLPHPERLTHDDLIYQCGKAVPAGSQLTGNLRHRLTVLAFDASAYCVGQELNGQIVNKEIRLCFENLFQLLRSVKGCAARKLTGAVDGKVTVAGAPRAGRIVILKTEADGIHLVVTDGTT